MSRKIASVLLVLSLGLNVSFVAGFLYVRRGLRELQTAEGRAEWAARKLRLDEGQHQDFLRQHADWRSAMRHVQRERKAEIEAFWREAVKDDADPAAVRARLDPLLDAQRQATVTGVDHLLRLFHILTPSQRAALVEVIRKKEQL